MSLSLTVGEALDQGRQALASISETPSLDAQLLLASALKRKKEWVLAHPEYHLSTSDSVTFKEILGRLVSGEALPYLLGSWEFFGHSFHVTPDVLIPRPETELLIENALGFLRSHPRARLCADIGTGSGCIAITLALEIPDLYVIAVDVSPFAIEVARVNARKHGVDDRVRLIVSDLLQPFDSRFGLICANLPYIPSKRMERLAVAEREPKLALDGGMDGLTVIRRLVYELPELLDHGGRALLEVDSSHARVLAGELSTMNPSVKIDVLKDVTGRERIVMLERMDLPGS
ncbi:MAG: peptide chain release factor N(5)-glutamine methyltransferase [Anaerolineales bacterium]|nr:peptide chain release factor N(5)-glutamine methyltransferase [Anaerolineales bacterium]